MEAGEKDRQMESRLFQSLRICEFSQLANSDEDLNEHDFALRKYVVTLDHRAEGVKNITVFTGDLRHVVMA